MTRAYTSNGLNQYTASGSATLTYDANGNLTGDGTDSYVYDDENHLVSASGTHSATLAYDPLGRLWQSVGSVTGTTDFEYDGDRLLEEFNSSGTLQRLYVYGDGGNPIVWYEFTGGTTRRYLLPDERGSTVAVADDSGNAVAINRYDEYGIPQSGNGGRFQYAGQALLIDLGLFYAKARIYSPTLGRFLQTDPIGYGDGMNWYAYVGADPVNGTDPDGLTMMTGTRIVPSGQNGGICMSCSGFTLYFGSGNPAADRRRQDSGGVAPPVAAEPPGGGDWWRPTREYWQNGNLLLSVPVGDWRPLWGSVDAHLMFAGGGNFLDCATPRCVTLIPPKPGFLAGQIGKHDGSAGIDAKPRSVFSARLQNPTQSLLAILGIMKTVIPIQVGDRLIYSGVLPYVTGFDRDGHISFALTVVVQLTGARDAFGQRIVTLCSYYPGFAGNVC